jgi:hypothetical protein
MRGRGPKIKDQRFRIAEDQRTRETCYLGWTEILRIRGKGKRRTKFLRYADRTCEIIARRKKIMGMYDIVQAASVSGILTAYSTVLQIKEISTRP